VTHPYLDAQRCTPSGADSKTLVFSTSSVFTTLSAYRWYEIWSTADCYVAVGPDGTVASTGSYALPLRTTSQPFKARGGQVIAAVALGSTAGILYIDSIVYDGG
jgi:hypothetical protein